MAFLVAGVLTISEENDSELFDTFSFINEAVYPLEHLFKVGGAHRFHVVDILLVIVDVCALVGVDAIVVEKSDDSLEGVFTVAPKSIANLQCADFDSLEGPSAHGATSVEASDEDLTLFIDKLAVLGISEVQELGFCHYDLELDEGVLFIDGEVVTLHVFCIISRFNHSEILNRYY